MNLGDFGGQKSKVKVTRDMYENKLVIMMRLNRCVLLHQTWQIF